MPIAKFLILTLAFSALSGCGTIEHKRGSNAEVLIRHFEQHNAKVKSCYSLHRTGVGFITIQWTVNDQGQISDIGLKERTLNNLDLENCLLREIKAISFPPTPRFTTATVEYKFQFSSSR